MEYSLKMFAEWKEAKQKQRNQLHKVVRSESCTKTKWQAPDVDVIKVNVDASVYPGSQTFSAGMVIRGHRGIFIARKNLYLPAVYLVFEAEVVGIIEALSWIQVQQFGQVVVQVESDSMLAIKAIVGEGMSMLEVGLVIEDRKRMLRSMRNTSICFVRKNVNSVAHELVRIPCLVNCQNYFTSSPTCLLEALACDLLS